MTALAGLARVTISAPQRRIDVALPAHVPVAEVLPELLGHAGEALADDGEQHGGWMLRRSSGEPLTGARDLHQQGIRDGEILHLVPVGAQWPELEYDDVVQAIAAGAQQTGRGWTPAATRAAALAAAGVSLAAGVLAILAAGSASPKWPIALGVALLLLLAGVTASRAYGEGLTGAVLAGYAMAYALTGGALGVSDGPAAVLLGGTALLLTAVLSAVGVGTARWVFVAGGTAGGLGGLGGLLAFALPADDAAAVALAVLSCGVGAVPLLAVRLGRLPMPAVTPPAGNGADGQGLDHARERPESAHVLDAVRRTGDLLTGMLVGHALVTAAACVVLARQGGTAGRLLVGAAGLVLLLRSRVFAAARHRVPVLAGGLAGLAALLLALLDRPGDAEALALVTVAVAVALVVAAAGTTYAKRPPSPYLGRAADLLDTALIVSVVPIAAAVLDLYVTVRGLVA
jgi:type VII secretion integral membrane protein EccD